MEQKESDVAEGDIDEEGNRLIQNQRSSNRYHANWLNMMYPRLRVAKDLLTDDGVIFISIDDNEQKNLKYICDEIFGEECFISQIVWKNKYGAGAKTVGFIEVHEYILCYSKIPIKNITSELSEDEEKKYTGKDQHYSKRGRYRTQPLATRSLGDRPNLVYPVKHKGQEIWPNKQWVWSKERMQSAIDNGFVEFTEKNSMYSIRAKQYLFDETGKKRRGKPLSLMNGPFNQDATFDMRALFNDKTIFGFSKPEKLIRYLLKMQINDINDNDFYILDFFSGSASAAHATMQLNAEDNGTRKFIMVQLIEKCDEKSEAYKAGYKTISEIGKERIRRAGEKILEENKDKEGIENLDIGFKVFKVGDTNIRWFSEAIKSENVEVNEELMSDKDKLDFNPGYKEIDVVYEILLRHRDIPLSSTIEKLDDIGKRTYIFADAVVVCLDEVVTEEMIDKIAAIEPMPTKIIFRDSAFEANISLKENSMIRLQAQMKKFSGAEKKAYKIEFI